MRMNEFDKIDRERVALDDDQPTRIARGNFFERRQTTRVALDHYDTFRAMSQQRAGEAAGAGTDLDDRHVFERTRGAGDARR